jgi:four helix bundle protein
MKINSYKELDVFQRAMNLAMEIFEITKQFPKEEQYSLTDQIRRSSRSVCANLSEAWRKRRYKAAFVSKLSDAETEACETQVWIEFAHRCKYLTERTALHLDEECDHIIAQLVRMIDNHEKWVIKKG